MGASTALRSFGPRGRRRSGIYLGGGRVEEVRDLSCGGGSRRSGFRVGVGAEGGQGLVWAGGRAWGAARRPGQALAEARVRRCVLAAYRDAGGVEHSADGAREVGVGAPGGPHLVSVEGDSSGELYLSASSGGCLAVHRLGARRPPPTRLMELDVKPPLHAAVWDPQDQVRAACVGLERMAVEIFDLERCTSGRRPQQRLRAAHRGAAIPGEGLLDVLYPRGGRYAGGSGVCAVSQRGGVFLWDPRATHDKPVWMHSPPTTYERRLPDGRSDVVRSLDASPCGNLLYAGTSRGTVCEWDLRAGRRAGTFGAHGQLQFPSRRFALQAAVAAAVTDEVEMETSWREEGEVQRSIAALRLDPGAPHRLGFQLACGRSGVYDLRGSPCVTHMHIPAAGRPGRPTWALGGHSFCVGAEGGLYLLDAYPGRAAATTPQEKARGPLGGVYVKVGGGDYPVTCLTENVRSSDLVVGCLGSCGLGGQKTEPRLHVVGTGYGTDEDADEGEPSNSQEGRSNAGEALPPTE